MEWLSGSNGAEYTAGTGIDITNNVISVNTTEIQPKLTAGSGITITDNVISATGGGSGQLSTLIMTCNGSLTLDGYADLTQSTFENGFDGDLSAGDVLVVEASIEESGVIVDGSMYDVQVYDEYTDGLGTHQTLRASCGGRFFQRTGDSYHIAKPTLVIPISSFLTFKDPSSPISGGRDFHVFIKMYNVATTSHMTPYVNVYRLS